MATLNVPDPAIVKTLSMRFSITEGVGSLSVSLPETYNLPSASFGPEEFSGPQLAAVASLRSTVIAMTKTRQEAFAAANGNTINWVVP